jgi:hypothetical protein
MRRFTPAEERFFEVRLEAAITTLLDRREMREPRTRLLYTFKHAAEMLDCSVAHVRELVAAGELVRHRDPIAGETAAAHVTAKSLREYVRKFDQSRVKNHPGLAIEFPGASKAREAEGRSSAPDHCPHGTITHHALSPRDVCNTCNPAISVTACGELSEAQA